MGSKRLNLFSIQLVKQRLILLRRTVFKSQYSIIPPFHYSMGHLTTEATPLRLGQSLVL